MRCIPVSLSLCVGMHDNPYDSTGNNFVSDFGQLSYKLQSIPERFANVLKISHARSCMPDVDRRHGISTLYTQNKYFFLRSLENLRFYSKRPHYSPTCFTLIFTSSHSKSTVGANGFFRPIRERVAMLKVATRQFAKRISWTSLCALRSGVFCYLPAAGRCTTQARGCLQYASPVQRRKTLHREGRRYESSEARPRLFAVRAAWRRARRLALSWKP